MKWLQSYSLEQKISLFFILDTIVLRVCVFSHLTLISLTPLMYTYLYMVYKRNVLMCTVFKNVFYLSLMYLSFSLPQCKCQKKKEKNIRRFSDGDPLLKRNLGRLIFTDNLCMSCMQLLTVCKKTKIESGRKRNSFE